MMNSRERTLATLLFQHPDRIPFEPGMPREKTLARWHREGLPKGADWFDVLCKTIGIKPDPYTTLPAKANHLIDFHMRPRFEEKVLEHENGHYLIQDWMGNIVEISDEYDYTYIREAKDFVTRKWHAFPVSSPQDFEMMKRRYRTDDPERYGNDFAETLRRLEHRDFIVTLIFPGPFWQLREWCGFEPLCMMLVESPQFVEEMILFWIDFVSRVMSPALDAGIVDHILINEDMAYKEKCMISPDMAERFLKPAWQRWVRQAGEAGVKLFDLDSDGYVGELVPVWIDSGLNVCDPIEVAAGNDINALRDEYGQKIAFRQGVDKRCIAKGGKAIENELQRLEPVIKSGGYLPGCDHGVPYDISWPDFVYYSTLLAELTGWL
jgi:hypothetical protein